MPEHTPIPEAKTLVIPWPTVPPLGFNVSAEGLKEAWESAWAPIYENEQSIEHRIIAGTLRAVFDGMHGITGVGNEREDHSAPQCSYTWPRGGADFHECARPAGHDYPHRDEFGEDEEQVSEPSVPSPAGPVRDNGKTEGED